MSGPLDHAHELLEKAGDDLVAAEAILPTGRALWTACFHAQQVVEKCLKAVLAADDLAYPYTHDLAELLPLLGNRMPELSPLEEGIIALTPFAATARYDRRVQANDARARDAIEVARTVYGLAAAKAGAKEKAIAEAEEEREDEPAREGDDGDADKHQPHVGPDEEVTP